MSERVNNGILLPILVALLIAGLLNLYGATIRNDQKMEYQLRDAQRRIALLEQQVKQQ